MIHTKKMKNGTSVSIAGDTYDLMEDLTSIIQSLRQCMSEKFPVETVDLLIASCGRMAYAETAEEREAVGKELSDMLYKAEEELIRKERAN